MDERHFAGIFWQQFLIQHAPEGGAIGALQVFVNHRAHWAVRQPFHDGLLRKQTHGREQQCRRRLHMCSGESAGAFGTPVLAAPGSRWLRGTIEEAVGAGGVNCSVAMSVTS